MNTNSNSYTMIYASVMVIIVAFLLAFVSSSLKATQNKNVDRIQQIREGYADERGRYADREYRCLCHRL